MKKESLQHPFLAKKVWPTEVIKILKSQVSVHGNAAYYSERYHSRREDDALSLLEWLSSDLPVNLSRAEGQVRISEVARKLDLEEHLQSSTMNLSNGQTKRATIAKALLSEPKVLLLDEPYVGLDARARENLSSVLGNLHSYGSTKVILALRPLDKVPAWATHVLWLNQDGTTRHVGPITSTVLSHLKQEVAAPITTTKNNLLAGDGGSSRKILVDLDKITVSYWDKPVLRSVSWTIRAGDKWNLKGANGSGKTTLLAMILGDHPKIYANKVYLFGHRRTTGDGKSIFELQADMGHSSPELHRHYPRYRTAKDCVSSAYGETFHPPRELSSEQSTAIQDIFKYFNLERHQDVKMGDLSPALQRLMLLMRALVKSPQLVILDEPFAGMDSDMISRAKKYIDEELRPHQALIFVTHYEDEIPSSILQTLILDKGQVIM